MKKQNLFIRAWKGEAKLWEAWWLIGLAAILIVRLVLMPLNAAAAASGEEGICYIIIAFMWAIQIFWWRSVWICAANPTKSGWTFLVKILIILAAFSSIGEFMSSCDKQKQSHSYVNYRKPEVQQPRPQPVERVKPSYTEPPAQPAPKPIVPEETIADQVLQVFPDLSQEACEAFRNKVSTSSFSTEEAMALLWQLMAEGETLLSEAEKEESASIYWKAVQTLSPDEQMLISKVNLKVNQGQGFDPQDQEKASALVQKGFATLSPEDNNRYIALRSRAVELALIRPSEAHEEFEKTKPTPSPAVQTKSPEEKYKRIHILTLKALASLPEDERLRYLELQMKSPEELTEAEYAERIQHSQKILQHLTEDERNEYMALIVDSLPSDLQENQEITEDTQAHREPKSTRDVPRAQTVVKEAIPENSTQHADYFTVGSTWDEVLAIQGQPDRFSKYSMQYGSSTVHFENKRVTRWSNGSPKLKARLNSSEPSSDISYFTVGSTWDEVIAIQGQPDRFSKYSMQYGSSTVHFENKRVTRWSNGSPKLKARF